MRDVWGRVGEASGNMLQGIYEYTYTMNAQLGASFASSRVSG